MAVKFRCSLLKLKVPYLDVAWTWCSRVTVCFNIVFSFIWYHFTKLAAVEGLELFYLKNGPFMQKWSLFTPRQTWIILSFPMRHEWPFNGPPINKLQGCHCSWHLTNVPTDSDRIDQNDSSQKSFLKNKSLIYTKSWCQLLLFTCKVILFNEPWYLSVAVTPNWDTQGTQNHSSSFHHVSIPMCIESQSHWSQQWHNETLMNEQCFLLGHSKLRPCSHCRA